MIVKNYKIRGDNILLFHSGMFLLLPLRQVKLLEGSIDVSKEAFAAALDVTPDLPPRILHAAWKDGMIFSNDVTATWAGGIASSSKMISASEILSAYQ